MPYCLQCGAKADIKIPAGDTRERIVCDSCGYIHYQNPNIICGALVIHEDNILMCRRAIEPQYGRWTLPAGFMEIGETMMAGAKRETFEEAEAIATDMKLYCLFDIPALGQVHAMYLARLQPADDGKLFGVGVESLETKLVSMNDIDWDDIAFESITRTLKHYHADSQNNKQIKEKGFDDFPLHQETIEKTIG